MLNSLLGIARQWSGEKFAIWTLKPRSHVRILMYMLLRCCYYYMLIVICIFFMGIKFREDFLPSKVPYRPPYRTMPVRDNNNHTPYAIAYSLEAARHLVPWALFPGFGDGAT